MERIEPTPGCQVHIHLILLNQIFDDIDVSVVRGVKQRGKALIVLDIHPSTDLLLLVPLI